MANFCCDLLGKQYIFANANLFRFVQKLQTQAENLDVFLVQSQRMETRLRSCEPENLAKVANERGTFYAEFKQALAEFNSGFEDRHFSKLEIHYSELSKVLRQIKAKINNDKSLLTLKRLGIM
jgi:hypothetical protein